MASDPNYDGWGVSLLIFGGLFVAAKVLFWREPLMVCVGFAALGTVLLSIFAQYKNPY